MKKYILVTIVFISSLFCDDHSINFDGQNDFVIIPDNAALDLTNNYTLEAWIFPESFSWLAGIISKYQTSAANGYMLRLTSQAPYTGLGFDEKITNTGVLSANQWHHIAAVNDNGQRRLYINGSLTSISGSALNVISNSDPIRLGSDYSSRYFDGRIDEVRIWNIARNQEEIVSSMDSSLTGQESGLVAYYNFDEGSGIILNDLTGNGHNGTVVGGLWSSGYSLSGLLGDINFDEILNVYDAVMLVAIMLGNENGNEYQVYACDTNRDDIIDLQDIVMLMQWILEIDIDSFDSISNAGFNQNGNVITIDSDGDIAGIQFQFSEDMNLSNINFPAGWSYAQNKNSIIAYSLNGSSIDKNFKVDFIKDIEIKNIEVVDWHGNSTQVKESINPSINFMNVSPNPFNSKCRIKLSLIRPGNADLSLYNVNGALVKKEQLGFLNVGNHELGWSPGNLSSGTYFIKTSVGKYSKSKKILYLK